MATIKSNAKMQVTSESVSGAAGGTLGARFAGVKKPGGTFERAVESVALQVPCVVAVPAVAVQVAGEPRAWVPFMNWTEPVTPGPLLVEPVTVALRVTMAPEVTVVELEVTAVVVGTVPVVTTVIVVEPLPEV